MPAPTLPLEGPATRAWVNGGNGLQAEARRPLLIFDTDQGIIEKPEVGLPPVLTSESPKTMQANHPTAGAMTLMAVEEPFTYVFDATVVAFYAGRTYILPTSVYNKLVAAGMPVTS